MKLWGTVTTLRVVQAGRSQGTLQYGDDCAIDFPFDATQVMFAESVLSQRPTLSKRLPSRGRGHGAIVQRDPPR